MYPLVSLTVLFIAIADFSSSNLLPDYGKLRRYKKYIISALFVAHVCKDWHYLLLP